MPLIKKIAVSLFVFVLGACVVCSIYLTANYTSSSKNEEQFVYIEQGATVSSIADNLHEQNIIGNPFLFKVFARLFHDPKQLKAGEYQIKAGASTKDVLDLLESGKSYQRLVTVPEGLTSYQIEKILYDKLEISQKLSKEGFIEPMGEGKILPDTYSYSYNETAQQIYNRMHQAQIDLLNELWDQRQENLPIKTKEQAIILASIVEKETGVNDERDKVAGVFINRLRKGMKLQTDPTVIYGITQGVIEDKGRGPLGRRLLRKDLEFDSPYNTYLYEGLPPGPICNPGKKAIAAVLNPQDHDYIYFVADGTGGHAFAKTLDQHNKNVAAWKKIRRTR